MKQSAKYFYPVYIDDNRQSPVCNKATDGCLGILSSLKIKYVNTSQVVM